MGDKLNAEQKQARKAGELARFVQQTAAGHARAWTRTTGGMTAISGHASSACGRRSWTGCCARTRSRRLPRPGLPALFASQASTGTCSSAAASFASDGS